MFLFYDHFYLIYLFVFIIFTLIFILIYISQSFINIFSCKTFLSVAYCLACTAVKREQVSTGLSFESGNSSEERTPY